MASANDVTFKTPEIPLTGANTVPINITGGDHEFIRNDRDVISRLVEMATSDDMTDQHRRTSTP